MPKIIFENVKMLKAKYLKEGFIIIGVFGSYARGDETSNSDIDILYELNDDFYNKNVGWDSYYRINEIKNDIHKILGVEVDLANRKAINQIGEKYIIPELYYVD